MSSTADKAKGYANEAAGAVKKAVGNLVGNDRLEAEGMAQKLKGEAQVATGKAKDVIKDTSDKVNDAIKKNL